MTDRTSDFLQCVRSVASSEALIKTVLAEECLPNKKNTEKPSSKCRSSVSTWKHRFDGLPQEALDICRSILQLHSMLLKNRIAYLTRHIGIQNSGVDGDAQSGGMSEQQRDEIDAEASTFITNTLHRIRLFQAKIETVIKQHFNSDKYSELKLHWESIVWYLEKKLTDLSKLQKDMQEKRLQQQEAQKKQEEAERLRSTVVEALVPTSPRKASEDNNMFFQLSAQEKQLLEKENEHLLDEFAGLEKQVGQAEKSLLEISQLQSTLETHVLTQYEEINRLHDEAAKITDQVTSGNAKLDSAAKHGADSRNIMVFFFLLLSFVMLFLHWYE